MKAELVTTQIHGKGNEKGRKLERKLSIKRW